MIKVRCSREMKDRREPETAESGELLFRSGGVFSNCARYSAQVKQLGAIQVQRRHGRSAYGRTSQNNDEVLAPCKVPLPKLPTRVEEWTNVPRLWVRSASLSVSVGVTPRARPGEIVQCRLAASLTWGNVFTVAGCVGEKGRAAAILA
jgi:hypothetical protein